ncbi:MAG: hypothetical protein AVDCRST_MAG33-577 [uncultured Thermomicrobiales bacterium]|uniref:Ribbon-helix-helix protein CopG domain-containing protein n=1 Tax=uncultured Thermomicrobiales bacterium TaxID=1645740 RepID=A0A6J4UDU0_9BACT|nr:MAG: hypothetical protein AVDCRST_MAG33-577 [uncultured Thermomicrobiales bacterium]
MSTATIRVQTKTRDRLQQLSIARKQSISTIVAEAVSQYDDAIFWADYREQLDALRADPVAWAEMQEEVTVFDGTLLDGLHDEPAT